MTAEFRMFLDNEAATAEQMDLFRVIRVDQAIGMVTEAELEMALQLDDTGQWVDFNQPFVEPLARIRVEVKPGDGDFVPLIDGPVIGQRIEMSASPNDSKITLVVHDDSVMLNRTEAVVVFEDKSAADIARQLFGDAGLQAEVEGATPDGGTLERAVVQRGTAMQLLRDLARGRGMVVHVRAGATPGASVGVFRPLTLDGEDLPELILVGETRNLDKLSVDFDGLRPFTAVAGSIDVADQTVLRAESTASSQTTLGDEASHDLAGPATVLLARTRETETDLDAAVAAAVDYASWAYSAAGEVDSAAYPAVMQPYATIAVAGAGPMSGRYLISQVTHTIDDQIYRQQFTLRRNARSSIAGGGPSLPGGVF
jgi:hypothetical protein